MITLRAHHLFCLLGFQGKGYSDSFVFKMQEIQNQIKAHPNTTLKIIAGQDDSCQACPHHFQNTCQKDPEANQRMLARDQAALSLLGCEENKVSPAKEIYDQLLALAQTKSNVENICKNCEWQGACTFYQSLV